VIEISEIERILRGKLDQREQEVASLNGVLSDVKEILRLLKSGAEHEVKGKLAEFAIEMIEGVER
jgi:hypothetical protein